MLDSRTYLNLYCKIFIIFFPLLLSFFVVFTSIPSKQYLLDVADYRPLSVCFEAGEIGEYLGKINKFEFIVQAKIIKYTRKILDLTVFSWPYSFLSLLEFFALYLSNRKWFWILGKKIKKKSLNTWHVVVFAWIIFKKWISTYFLSDKLKNCTKIVQWGRRTKKLNVA